MESAKSEAISALQSVGSHPIFAFFPGAMLVFASSAPVDPVSVMSACPER
jgi:hypothetical protein